MTAAPRFGEPAELAEIVDVVTDSVDPRHAGERRYVGLEHIDSGEVFLRRAAHPDSVRSRKTLFQAGDVLYGKLRPYLDKSVLAEAPGICSTDLLVFRPRREVDPLYLTFLLHTRPFIRHAIATTSGSNHPRTSWSALRQFVFELPEKTEQIAIARMLRTVKHATEQTHQVIQAGSDLKRSVREHVFTNGPVPAADVEQSASWRMVALEDVTPADRPICYGILKPGPNVPDGVPYVKVRDYPDGQIQIDHLHRTTAEIARQYRRSELRAGDVLVSIRGTYGRVTVVPPELAGANITQDTARVSPSESFDRDFVMHYLQSDAAQEYIRASAKGVAVRGINIRELRNLPVPAPSSSEQRRISSALTRIDRKLAAERQRLEALQAIYTALLHDLTSGAMPLVAGGREVG